MTKTVAIIGATGQQGGAVAAAALAKGWKVRAATRNPDSDKAKALAAKAKDQVELVKLDLSGDVAELEKLFKGADAAFGVTDFWGLIAGLQGDGKKAMEIEVAQGKKIVDAAKAAGVPHLVLSTLANVMKESGDKLPVLHFDGKGMVEEYALKSGVPVTCVRYSFYDENFGSFFPPNDKNEIVLPMADFPMGVVDLQTAGAAVAGILERGPKNYAGKVIGLVTDRQPVEKYVEQLGAARGTKYTYVSPTLEAFAGFFPGAQEMANMFQYYRDFPQDKFDQAATKELAGADFRTFAQWAAAEAAQKKA